MDRRSLYDGLNQLEFKMEENLEQLTTMKETLLELVEKNTTLEIENQRLRERILEMNQKAHPQTTDEKQGLSQSKMNLEKIYEDGFHVCNLLYGSRREDDEPCAFCLDVIYSESKPSK
ncbi:MULTISPECIES: DNA replication initiation control protein YabA [Enterococcus]|uniref:Replication initiation control protein YabA n=1 Tax=Enterococcus alishanensis TaxID=1303817 RepID=A0ABS6T8R6_9ENTE|nr:DNA replication initiation control protein YabA [Enterococcus alishanensis]MBV7389291.1 DNA replication initiation control protein YabA [Enterococcus alishanensis]